MFSPILKRKDNFFHKDFMARFEVYILIRMGPRDFFHLRLRISVGIGGWFISVRWLVRGNKRVFCAKPLILWHGQLFSIYMYRKLLRYSIFECFDTSNLREKRVWHEVAKKYQPIDGFRPLQNSRPNYPWADFHHGVRISSSKKSYCSFWPHVLFLRTIVNAYSEAMKPCQ